jgi:peptidoglycan lytic transglycosylase G
MKKVLIAALILTFIAVSGSFCVVTEMSHFAKTPASAVSKEKIVVVTTGEQLNTIATRLRQQQLISSEFKFRLLATIKQLDTKIQTGEFRLSATLTPMEILDKMVSGKIVLHRLTIPEGYNLEQIASAVEAAGFGPAAQFMKASVDPDLLKRLEVEAGSFEGYLFPDTYHFSKHTPASGIITAMIKQFHSVFTPRMQARAREIGLSPHLVVTLASIIEKESNHGAELPLISSVFHNRLKKGMRLQSDPTVIYGIKDYDGNITRKHLDTVTPYNTYRIKGLPPGPIASPGLAAIQAALNPAESNFLFFVSKNDRTHYFSTNYNAHKQAVEKYQRSKQSD